MVKSDISIWEVRYSKYIGDLSVFDKKIYNMNTDELRSDQVGNGIFVTFDKITNQPMMIEVKDADKRIAGIDNMDKSSIINIVKEYIA